MPNEELLMNRLKSKPTIFAKSLRALMSEKKVTVRQAAKMAGVSPSTIDDWRAGATPSDYLAVRELANALGVGFEMLLTGKQPVNQSKLSVTEVFEEDVMLFDGYAKISIQRLIPRGK